MTDLANGGFSEEQLVSLGGFLFVAKISGCWKDGKFVEKNDFTAEMISALAVHHATSLKERITNIGSE